MNEVINSHAIKVWESNDIPVPSENDEAEVMSALFGIARLIEINVRIAWQTFCNQEHLSEESSPSRYINVLKLIDQYLNNDPVHWLYKNALTVTDGMLHGDFHQAYVQAQKAYERKDLGLVQSVFIKQTIAVFKSTGKDLNIDAKTGSVTTVDGQPVPHASFIPSKNKTIEENFRAFYVAGSFVPVYDVLFTAYGRAYHFRKCVSAATPKNQH